MSTDPDQIRADIERTRTELSSDVDALSDKVSPTQAAQRQADRLKSAASSVKDRVLGSVHDGSDAVGSSASSLGDKTTALPGAARDRAAGNPLAAGLVAFGAGLLVASLLPSTRREQDLATGAKEQAAPLVEDVKGAAQDVAANLKAPAQEAAAAVKDTATDAAAHVKDQGRSAVQDVKSEATGSSPDTETPSGFTSGFASEATPDDGGGAHVARDLP
ncbi:DUF3618 domain-containing protein [Cellulomonas rhizosphaerae]|uniref:DUF3618 domain-containing protein n=1 Tax=Cellulomonas rhizosphaerae TaxID=2293719 RepID=A0A413RR25_9CELL|nr:DUF3618 domain-containing protein [Cellulomonas rhizosphaerae]RHA44439.1 DUF3618 domain-containing protein [Cellulomonas rhizosphaerae]